jgi:hypothetical protein
VSGSFQLDSGVPFVHVFRAPSATSCKTQRVTSFMLIKVSPLVFSTQIGSLSDDSPDKFYSGRMPLLSANSQVVERTFLYSPMNTFVHLQVSKWLNYTLYQELNKGHITERSLDRLLSQTGTVGSRINSLFEHVQMPVSRR